MLNKALCLFTVISMCGKVCSQTNVDACLVPVGHKELIMEPVGEYGIVLLTLDSEEKNPRSYDNNKMCRVEHFDTSFNLLGSNNLENYLGYHSVVHAVFEKPLSFVNGEEVHFVQFDAERLSVNHVCYNVSTKEIIENRSENLGLSDKVKLVNLSVLGEYVHLFVIDEGKPYMIRMDWVLGESQKLPWRFDTNIEKLKLYFKEAQGFPDLGLNFLCIKANSFSVYDDKDKASFFITSIDESGEYGETVDLARKMRKFIATAKLAPISDFEFMVCGTYSSWHRNGSEGVYFAKMDGENLIASNYVKFEGINGFVDNMSSSTKQEFERKKERGIDCHVRGEKLLKLNDGSILYCAQAVTNERYMFYQGSPASNGNVTSHLILIRFDSSGEVLWSQSLPANDYSFYERVKDYYVARLDTSNYEVMISSPASRNEPSWQGVVSFYVDLDDGSIINEELSTALNQRYEFKEANAKEFRTLPYYHSATPWYGSKFLVWKSTMVKVKKAPKGHKFQDRIVIKLLDYKSSH